MSKRKHPISYNCKHCGTESRYDGHKANIYCSVRCQKDYESKERIRQWLEEGKDWGLSIPAWVHRTLEDQRGYACEVCKIEEWNGMAIKLECDHIDGNHANNHISNLRLICPNCHSQTNTYKNLNKGNGRTNRRQNFSHIIGE